ncbi:MAG: class II aldolase/adducin family protein [Patescibacteria group bacterium]|nr:class II aldolase/adducin family protein [Patescibacteria group bacterium]
MGEKYIGTKFKTIYKGDFKPNARELKLIKDLIKVGKDLAKLGCKDNNGGNFSVRTKNGIIIKTTGSFPHQLKKSDFSLVVGFKKDEVYTFGQKEPSSEARLHWGVYQARPDINCVLHSHDFLAVNCEQKIKDVIYVKEYSYGTMESARAIKNASKKGDYLIMQNHGVLALGKNISSSLKLIQKYHEKFKAITKGPTFNCRVKKR